MQTKRERLLIFSGTHIRYKYLANQLLNKYSDSCLIAQNVTKGDYVGKYDNNNFYDANTIELLNNHLKVRDNIEKHYFLEENFLLKKTHQVLTVGSESLNSLTTIRFIENVQPTVVFSFGIGMLNKQVLDALKNVHIVNYHLGLSPYYRSSDTLLWPLYLQKPGHIGFTLHQIDSKPDHGRIYHQQQTSFNKQDSIHSIFCKTIVQGTKPTIKLIDALMKDKCIHLFRPKVEGKVFFKNEFTPNHLKIIYQLIEDGMLSKYLDDQYQKSNLNLYSCFN